MSAELILHLKCCPMEPKEDTISKSCGALPKNAALPKNSAMSKIITTLSKTGTETHDDLVSSSKIFSKFKAAPQDNSLPPAGNAATVGTIEPEAAVSEYTASQGSKGDCGSHDATLQSSLKLTSELVEALKSTIPTPQVSKARPSRRCYIFCCFSHK